MPESKYPECDKIVANHEKSQVIGEFLDWLEEWHPTEAEKVLARMKGRREYFSSKEKLLAEYFGIDLNKVEVERRALLESIRKGGNP
jgi:hypothetical protein